MNIKTLLTLLAALTLTAWAADDETQTDVATTPTANMNASLLRIVPQGFTIGGHHTFSVYKLSPDGKVVDREEVTLLRPASLTWLQSSNRATALQGIILARTSLKVNTNTFSLTNTVTLTNYVTITNTVTK
jgi:hypothetical protein